jgi:CheY-like chemotaxis protein
MFAASQAQGAPQWQALYIEDNPANLLLVQQILARRGDVRFVGARTPAQGLALATADRPDVILLDINLPEMDGYGVLACLREYPTLRDVPVVAISANAMPQDLARGEAAGFHAYLTKPLDVAVLGRVLDRIVATRRGQGAEVSVSAAP